LETAAHPTTLVESNVVGNLYYAWSFKWAQQILDQHLWRQAPGVLRARGALGELCVESLRVEYLREAMPFDTVTVSLHPAEAEGPPGAWDRVSQRSGAAGPPPRLALGHVTATWSRPTPHGRVALPVPAWLSPLSAPALPAVPEVLHGK